MNIIRVAEMLEPGISIGGITGNIMTHCELNKIPGFAYFSLN